MTDTQGNGDSGTNLPDSNSNLEGAGRTVPRPRRQGGPGTDRTALAKQILATVARTCCETTFGTPHTSACGFGVRAKDEIVYADHLKKQRKIRRCQCGGVAIEDHMEARIVEDMFHVQKKIMQRQGCHQIIDPSDPANQLPKIGQTRLHGFPGEMQVFTDRGWRALDEMVNRTVTASLHAYTSTACFHLVHAQCRQECKFCHVPCRCGCHDPNDSSGVEAKNS